MEGQSRAVDLGGARFHYLEYGDPSRRPLVFLHGIFTSAADYDDLLRPLARTRRVIALDQRGHGETDHAEEYSWAGLADDLVAFVTALELPRFDLVGYSMGAFVGALYCGIHPGAVERLVLIEGGLEPPRSPEAPAFWAKLGSLLFSPDGHASQEDFVDAAAAAFPRAAREALVKSSRRLVRRPDGRWTWPLADLKIGSLAGQRNDDHAAAVAAIRVPTLVLRGAASELFVADGFAPMAATIEQAHVEIMEGTGHLFIWENTAAAVTLIERFLDAHIEK